MSIPELSRIYPTPPSVEMEVDKFDEIKEERTESTSVVTSTPAPRWDTDLVGYVHNLNFVQYSNVVIFWYSRMMIMYLLSLLLFMI